MSFRAVLFDAAGTLFRVRGSVGEAYAGVAARHGVTAGAADIEQRFRAAFSAMPPLCFPGVPAAEIPAHEHVWWRQVVNAAFAGFRFDDFDTFFADLFGYFAQPESWELFPDVRPTLSDLRARNLPLAIVSNFDSRLTEICAGLDIAGFFDTIVMSAQVGCAKPDPKIFHIALGRLGVAADQALHVGDSVTLDLQGAERAGLHALLIDRGSDSGDRRIRDLRQLLSTG